MINKGLVMPPRPLVLDLVRAAIQEDVGAGDVTSAAIIPSEATARGAIVARKPGVLAGIDVARSAFAIVDPGVRFATKSDDGTSLVTGSAAAEVDGSARSILAAERVALNFLGHLSGIATATAALVERVKHTHAKIVDTRKTMPGLRALEKYAVRCGGGSNHRFGLGDAILIKDNHIAVAGGIGEAVRRARTYAGHMTKIEVEVESLDQLAEAMAAGPDVVMFDNMSLADMREGVRIVRGCALTEASGNVTLETVAAIAETGVDMISSGWITHSAPALDLALDVTLE